MAGVVGFEPTVHGTKNRCLTTWLHPNGGALITPGGFGVQAPFAGKMHLFFSAALTGDAGSFGRGVGGQQILVVLVPAFLVDNGLKFVLGMGLHVQRFGLGRAGGGLGGFGAACR